MITVPNKVIQALSNLVWGPSRKWPFLLCYHFTVPCLHIRVLAIRKNTEKPDTSVRRDAYQVLRRPPFVPQQLASKSQFQVSHTGISPPLPDWLRNHQWRTSSLQVHTDKKSEDLKTPTLPQSVSFCFQQAPCLPPRCFPGKTFPFFSSAHLVTLQRKLLCLQPIPSFLFLN